MSTIGNAGYAAQIASSLARTHRGDADAARLAASASQQSAQRESVGPDAIEDAAKADLSTDRDPDGRRAWEFGGPLEDEDSDADGKPRKPRRIKISDTIDSIGGHLDIEA